MNNPKEWFIADHPDAKDTYVSAHGCLVMCCVAFRLEDRAVKLLLCEPDEGRMPRLKINPDNKEDPFIIAQIRLPELFVSNCPLDLPKVYWTGEEWLDQYSKPTYGPMVVK